MAQVIKDIVNWLKQWFYTKSEVNAIIPSDIGQLSNNFDTKFNPLTNQLPTATESNQTDLNNYTTAGFYYYQGTSASMSYIQNCPISFRYFVLLVETLDGVYYSKQTLTSFGDVNVQEYVRVKRGNSGWTNWRRVTYTS